MKAIPIWSPRYWDKKVLVDVSKLQPDTTFIFFCCDRNLTDLYAIDSNRVRENCSVCTNGKIDCYEIPLSYLRSMGDLPEEYIAIRDREYSKFKKYKGARK
jgi:hypothetical protein